MSVKIEGVPDGYELVRIGVPKEGEAFIGACSSVVHAPQDFCSGGYAIVRKIEPPKPIEPPEGYRLLEDDEAVQKDDIRFFVNAKTVAYARKITPQVRPMTRDEFLAAWKQRGFCPLIDPDDDYDFFDRIVIDDCNDDQEIISLRNRGWCSLDELAAFRFAKDKTFLTVEE